MVLGIEVGQVRDTTCGIDRCKVKWRQRSYFSFHAYPRTGKGAMGQHSMLNCFGCVLGTHTKCLRCVDFKEPGRKMLLRWKYISKGGKYSFIKRGTFPWDQQSIGFYGRMTFEATIFNVGKSQFSTQTKIGTN